MANWKTTHAIRSQKCMAERTDQSPDHGKCMSSSLYPVNIGSGRSWIRGKRGHGLAVGRGKKPILGFLLRLFWGKCPVGMTCHPKEVMMSWNH